MEPQVEQPRVAVIVPARNEEATIASCVQSLLQQTYRNREIIVIDDGSSDGTRQILEDFPEVTVLDGDGRGPSRARNLGIAATRAEIIAFTDADCTCAPIWLQELVDALEQGSYVGAGGDQASPADESVFGHKVQSFLKAVGFVGDYARRTDRVAPARHNPTCNSAYYRWILQQVGGLDEALWPGEDVDLDRRITRRGHRLVYTPRAVVYHYRPADMRSFCKMMRSYGAAQGYLVRKHGPFRLLHAVPLFFWGGALGAPLLVLPLMLPLSLLGLGGLPWALFRARGATTTEAADQVMLLYVTLLWWNLGFAEEVLYRRMACRQ